MVWVIPTFPDQSVSLASEKWLRNNDKKCYFPKTNILRKLKNEADVDKKSGEWSLHPCRLLFEGQRFATYKEAREAEKIAQNHSTMASFQDSYFAKQEARKHPNVFDTSSSSSENEGKDFKNIKKLAKLDAGLNLKDKKYEYNRKDKDNHSPPLSEKADDQSVNSASKEPSDEIDNHDDDWSIVTGATNKDSNCDWNDVNDGEIDGDDEENVSSNDEGEENVSSNGEGEDNVSSNDVHRNLTVNESDFQINMDNNLESTDQLISPTNGYDFNEDRRLVRLEKLLSYACQELVLIKADVKDIKKKSGESETVAQNMASICKDLSVEVFACTAEIKKRNGMFTDVLVPDIKMPIKRTKQYGDVELALGRHKIVDNLIKYLASTINEVKEKLFIRTCFKVIFGLRFFCTKVWWKKMPKRVLIKNSQILHCMRESFKIKFGLNEPKKTDKEIDKLIYKVSRNVKDTWRKTQKQNVKDDVTIQDDDNWNAMERKGSRKNRISGNTESDEQVEENKKAAKKPRKNQIQADEARTGESDSKASEESNYTRAAEEHSEEKKAKKAAKKAKKARQAAEEAIRVADETTRAADEGTRATDEKSEKKKAKKAAREESQQDGMPKAKKPKKSKKE